MRRSAGFPMMPPLESISPASGKVVRDKPLKLCVEFGM